MEMYLGRNKLKSRKGKTNIQVYKGDSGISKTNYDILINDTTLYVNQTKTFIITLSNGGKFNTMGNITLDNSNATLQNSFIDSNGNLQITLSGLDDGSIEISLADFRDTNNSIILSNNPVSINILASMSVTIAINNTSVNLGEALTKVFTLSNGQSFGNIGTITKNNSNINIGNPNITIGQLRVSITGVTVGTTILSFSGFKNSEGVNLDITNSLTITCVAATISNHATLSNGLVSYYKFDGNVNDSKGSNHGSIISTGYDFRAGVINQGFHTQKNIGNTRAKIPVPLFTSNNIWSINFWFIADNNPTTTQNNIIDVLKGDTFNFDNPFIAISWYKSDVLTTGLSTQFFTNGNWLQLVVPQQYVPSAGSKCMLSLDMNNGSVSITINGIQVKTGTMTWGLLVDNISISGINTGIDRGFNGLTDELGIWIGRNTTNQEKIDLYNSGNGLPYN